MQFFLSAVALLSAANVGAAAAVVKRDCSFTWAAGSGDTCQSMAVSWGLTQAQFISYNPGVVCTALVVGKECTLIWATHITSGLLPRYLLHVLTAPII